MAYPPSAPPHLHLVTQQSSPYTDSQSVIDTKTVPPVQYKAYSPHPSTYDSQISSQLLSLNLEQPSTPQYKAYSPPSSQYQAAPVSEQASQSQPAQNVPQAPQSQQTFCHQKSPLSQAEPFSPQGDQPQSAPSFHQDSQSQLTTDFPQAPQSQPTSYPLQAPQSQPIPLSPNASQSQPAPYFPETAQLELKSPLQSQQPQSAHILLQTSEPQSAPYFSQAVQSHPTTNPPQFPQIYQSQPAPFPPQISQIQPGHCFPQSTQLPLTSYPPQDYQPQPAPFNPQNSHFHSACSPPVVSELQPSPFPQQISQPQPTPFYPPQNSQLPPPPPYSPQDPQSQSTYYLPQASKLQPISYSTPAPQPQLTSYNPQAFPPAPISISSGVQNYVPTTNQPNASYHSSTPVYSQPPIPAAYEPARGPQDGYFASGQAQPQSSLDQKPHQSLNTFSTKDQGPGIPPTGFPPTPGYTPTESTPTSGYSPSGFLPTTQQLPATPSYTPTGSAPTGTIPSQFDDEVKSHWAKRFGGNMLLVRGARAGVTTVMSSVKLPATLSPWGDNNPVTLPNIRKRDLVLAVGAHVGADLIMGPAAEGLSFAGSVLAKAVTSVSEQAVDQGILDRLSKEKDKILQTTAVKSLQFTVKHSLMGENALLRFFEETPASYAEMMSCAKGWFCPYLYASGRTPSISRSSNFSVAQLTSPGLSSDYKLAEKLLAEGAATLSLCDPQPTHYINSNRMIVLFVGITPWRTSAWSQARIPGEARLRFHLINGCPAFVLPVTKDAPVCAWSSWTLKDMVTPGYQPTKQYESIFRFLENLIQMESVEWAKKENYRNFMGACIKLIIEGAIQTKTVDSTILGSIDPERAGIVMFRY